MAVVVAELEGDDNEVREEDLKRVEDKVVRVAGMVTEEGGSGDDMHHNAKVDQSDEGEMVCKHELSELLTSVLGFY